MDVLERLKVELNNKEYYSDEVLAVYLGENDLFDSNPYDKATMQKQLLQTVRDIFESLANNIDLFRSVETEFATTGDAYRWIEKRIEGLEKRILSIADADGEKTSCFNFMYHS